MLPKTVSLEQVKTLVRELEQEDVCDMEVDLKSGGKSRMLRC